MGRIGFGELFILLAIVLLVVGAKRLPGLARAMGEAVKEFQRAIKEGNDKERDEH